MTISPLPGFTAAASLYQSSAHYRTGTRATNLRRHQPGTVRLSAIDVPGEVIEIEDDAPWSPPSWGGHTGPGTSGGSSETGGGSGGASGGTEPPKKPPKPPQKKFKPNTDKPCYIEVSAESEGVTITETFLGKGSYLKSSFPPPKGSWHCLPASPGTGQTGAQCGFSARYVDGMTRTFRCYNGYSPDSNLPGALAQAKF